MHDSCHTVGLYREGTPDAVIIAMTDPYLLGIPASMVAHLRDAGCPKCLRDVFPEVTEPMNLLRPRALASLLRILRKRSLRHADTTVVIGAYVVARVAPFQFPQD